jgi:hypothetical protein
MAPADTSSTLEPPTELSIAGRDEPRVRDPLVAAAGTSRSALSGVLARRRRPPVARPADPPRPGFVATHLSRGHRSPAARPPEWVEGLAPEPAEPDEASAPQRSPAAHPPRWLNDVFDRGAAARPGLGGPAPTDDVDAALPDTRRHDPSRPTPRADADEREAPAAADTDNSERLPPAAQPTPWLSTRRWSAQAGDGSSAGGEGARRQTKKTSGASPDTGTASASRTDIVYQIAWRPDDDWGVFELRPVAPSNTSDAPAGKESPPVLWGWGMDPAPIPEAGRAHEALVNRLLVAKWQQVGSGDTWFGHRFRAPESAAKSDAPLTDG